MKLLTFCSLLLLPGSGEEIQADSPSPSGTRPLTPDANVIQAEAFELSDLRLLPGVFKANQDADKKYLLSLDPDRLLHNFRITAKLPSAAKPLGGWEAPNFKFRGHFTGHFLSACAEMYAATGDQQLRDRGTYMVAELGKCQDAIGTGYLSGFPPDAFDQLEANKTGFAVPYYSIHKIMAGLLDQYLYCGNNQALDITIKMADYFRGRMAKLTPEQIEVMLNTGHHAPENEFGGMSEALHNLYAITFRKEFLDFADVFDRSWFLSPLAMGQDELKGLHANTHIPQVIGFARHYELTGDERYRLAASFFWEEVTDHHSYVTGSNSQGEHFPAPDVESKALGWNTGESCNVYNMLKLTQHLFSWKPDPAYADYYELALYNHILHSIDPDSGMTTYFISLKPGHFKTYCTPNNSFWCCTGTGIENHAKYGGAIYYHNEDSLWVNLFIPSELSWKNKALRLTQTTDYPEKALTTLTVAVARPIHLKILLRIPAWTASDGIVKVNGITQTIAATKGTYATLDRTWNNGDKIELTLAMALHLHHAADSPNDTAILYGPLVLAGDLGDDGIPKIDQAKENGDFSKTSDPQVSTLVGRSDDLNSWIKSFGGAPLSFATVHAGSPSDVTLKPFYEIHHQRYTLYWKFTDAAPK